MQVPAMAPYPRGTAVRLDADGSRLATMGQLGFEPRASRLSAERSYLAELLALSAHHDLPPRVV